MLFFTGLACVKHQNPNVELNKGHAMKNPHPAGNPAIVLIFPKDVLIILVHLKTYSGAWRHYRNIKDNLGKKKSQKLTVQEFAEWEGLDPHSVLQRLTA